jgi:hypothetical protein
MYSFLFDDLLAVLLATCSSPKGKTQEQHLKEVQRCNVLQALERMHMNAILVKSTTLPSYRMFTGVLLTA